MEKTEEGYKFFDANDFPCTIKKSHTTRLNLDEELIRFGIEDKRQLNIHLTQSQVIELLPMLIRFAIIGDLVDRQLTIIVFEIPNNGNNPYISSLLGDFTLTQLQKIEQAFIENKLEYPKDTTCVVCEVWKVEDPDKPKLEFKILDHNGTEKLESEVIEISL